MLLTTGGTTTAPGETATASRRPRDCLIASTRFAAEVVMHSAGPRGPGRHG